MEQAADFRRTSLVESCILYRSESLWPSSPIAGSFFERVARATLDPGEAPANGDELAPARIGHSGACLRRASVLVPLFEDSGDPGVLLVKRSEDVRLHKGEISFPGGTVEEGDRDSLDTALRETEEEIGLPRSDIEIIGRLPVGVTAVSYYLVTPYVGVIPSDPSRLKPQPSEVAEVLWVSVSEFLEEGSLRVAEKKFDGVELPVYYFYLSSGEIVWGLTARILYDLLTRAGLLQP